MNGTVVFQIILFAMLTIYILVKEVVIPKRDQKRISNPINLDRFYQSWLDFRKAQEKFNDEIKGDIKELDKRIDKIERK